MSPLCPTFKFINQLADYYVTWYMCYVIRCYSNPIFLISCCHNMPDAQTYNMTMKLMSLNVYLSIYSPLLDLGRCFSFLIIYTVGRIPWTGISPSQGLYIHTQQHKHRINAHKHPCLEWDSNPRFQCSSGRRQFMP
jgi:hypothetical protein